MLLLDEKVFLPVLRREVSLGLDVDAVREQEVRRVGMTGGGLFICDFDRFILCRDTGLCKLSGNLVL